MLIHTVKCMYLAFEQQLRQELKQEVIIDNILDTYYASNSNELGYFSQANIDRLYLTLKSAELTGADVIAVICSTLSPYAEKIAPLIPVPIVLIDSQLGQKAVSYGRNLFIFASAPSAAEATALLIKKSAEDVGTQVNMETKYDIRAFHAMMSGDMCDHDKYLIETAREIKTADAVVFAQGSMEHLADQVAEITGLPVLTAPKLCIKEIKRLIDLN